MYKSLLKLRLGAHFRKEVGKTVREIREFPMQLPPRKVSLTECCNMSWTKMVTIAMPRRTREKPTWFQIYRDYKQWRNAKNQWNSLPYGRLHQIFIWTKVLSLKIYIQVTPNNLVGCHYVFRNTYKHTYICNNK